MNREIYQVCRRLVSGQTVEGEDAHMLWEERGTKTALYFVLALIDAGRYGDARTAVLGLLLKLEEEGP